MTARSTAKPKRPFWHYMGDINIEYGGYFYNLATFEDGYVEVVRVQPCADAGGPDNMFWIEQLSVNIDAHWRIAFWGIGDTVAERRAHRTLHDIPDAEHTERALRCCGWDERLDEWDKMTKAQRKHVITDAGLSYGNFDQESSTLVSVGKPDIQPRHKHEGSWEPEKVLRSNVNLRKYVLKNHT